MPGTSTNVWFAAILRDPHRVGPHVYDVLVGRPTIGVPVLAIGVDGAHLIVGSPTIDAPDLTTQ